MQHIVSLIDSNYKKGYTLDRIDIDRHWDSLSEVFLWDQKLLITIFREKKNESIMLITHTTRTV